jgi:hypothetical protein
MFVRSKVHLAAALLAVAAGAFADAQAGGLTCDNLCRDRHEHKYCNSGPCVKFVLPSCLLCSPGLNYLCVDRNDYSSLRPYCKEPLTGDTTTEVHSYDNCNPLCDCNSAAVVEASMIGDGTYLNIVNRYVCRL